MVDLKPMLLAKQRDFLLREKLFSLKDKVDIMDPLTQEPVGSVERKIFSIRTLYRLYNRGFLNEMIVQQKLLSFPAAYKFYTGNDNGEPEDAACLGILKKKFLSLAPSYWFETPDGKRVFEMRGDFVGLTYGVVQDGKEIADISRTFWAIRDTYGIRINPEVPDQMALLVLCSVIVIHAIHEARKNRGWS